MRNAHGEFIWYELMTTDVAAANLFYGPVAGWSIGESVPGPVDYRMIDTGDGLVGGALTLTREMTEHGAKPMILGYIGVDDVNVTVTAIETAGGKVLRPASDMDGVGRIAMVADPQGVPFYVIRGSIEAVSTCFAPDKPGHAAWNELQTSNLDAAKHFYPAVFGWKLGDVMPMGEMGDYQFIEHGGQMIGAMMTAPPGAPTVWGFAFNNPDIDGATDRIQSAGGVVIQGPIAVPGDQRVITASDPEGVPFMLVGK